MKRNLQVLKIISTLMIFILLILLTGCYNTKVISFSELNYSTRLDYVIHSQKSKYVLENTIISNGILSGKINPKYHSDNEQILVYLSSDSVMKINKENILSTPLDNIAKVEKKELSSFKMILLSVGSVVGLYFLIASINLAINGLGIELDM